MTKKEFRKTLILISDDISNPAVESIIDDFEDELFKTIKEPTKCGIVLENIVEKLEENNLDTTKTIEVFKEYGIEVVSSSKILISYKDSFRPSEYLFNKFNIHLYMDVVFKDAITLIKSNKKSNDFTKSQSKNIFNDIVQELQDEHDNEIYIEVQHKAKNGDISYQEQIWSGSHIKVDNIAVRSGRFEPHSPMLWEKGYSDNFNFFNRFYPTKHMMVNIKLTEEKEIPPMFDKLISNLTNTDEEKFGLINWLAYYYQTFQKSTAAWIIKGEKGTGKGILMDLLRNIYGADYIYKESDSKSITNQFNSHWKDKLYIIFEEVDFTSLKADTNVIHSRLKDIITDKFINIEGKGTNKVPNYPFYSNIMFFSNKEHPVEIETGDRRYNIVEATKSLASHDWWEGEKTAQEIMGEYKEVAEYFANYKTDSILYNKLIQNDTRAEQIESSLDDSLFFINKIKENDIEWLLSHSSLRNIEKNGTYTWGKHVKFLFNREKLYNGKVRISKSDLETMFNLIYGQDLNIKLLSKNNFKYKPYSINNYSINCYTFDYIPVVLTEQIQEDIQEVEIVETIKTVTTTKKITGNDLKKTTKGRSKKAIEKGPSTSKRRTPSLLGGKR